MSQQRLRNRLLITKKVYDEAMKIHLINSNENLTTMVLKYGFNIPK